MTWLQNLYRLESPRVIQLWLLYYFVSDCKSFNVLLFPPRPSAGRKLCKVKRNNRDGKILFKSLTPLNSGPRPHAPPPGCFPKASAKVRLSKLPTKYFNIILQNSRQKTRCFRISWHRLESGRARPWRHQHAVNQKQPTSTVPRYTLKPQY